ncbi:glycosyltransferase family 4 protein [Laspinema olomoucense]|uniref:Glycosyltransferase family 4 protein n=1 Tax=Laspinema olomoucense D3b TaxID=2953688 RepID=A0ABT2N0Z1_9CYAN|nr:glycosyltransferase family 4 protein [Laspinema sp. D3b]MCT7976262.1 glycosyltransferase family 4 protein [Laspinema sp. D3b]
MKIAVVGAKGLPALQGGIERYCEEMYPGMVEQGHTVDLFARQSYTQGSNFETYHYKGVRVISLPSIPLKGVDAFFASGLGAIASILNTYDVVHFHALGPAIFCWLPKLTRSAKVVVTCHGLDWQRRKWGKLSSEIIYRGERAAVSFADEIVVVSKELQTYFWKTYGIETSYIPTAPATYHESDPTLPYLTTLGLEPQRYILFLGRLVPEKRPDLLLKAFTKLQPPGWKLVLAGGVSDTPGFREELVQISQGNPQITFTGEIHGESVAQIVRGAGLFVLPSDVEGLPLVMLEAMREKIPVLASNIPPHRQLIGEDRGLLFEAGDLESCIQRLNQALSQREQLTEMASRAHDYVKQNHSWDRIGFENLSLYAKISKKLRTMEPLKRVPVANGTEQLAQKPKWNGVELLRELPLTNVTAEVPPLSTRREEGVLVSYPD